MVLILNKDITEAAWLRRRNPRFKLREQVSGLPGINYACSYRSWYRSCQPKPGKQKESQCWLMYLDSRDRNGSGEARRDEQDSFFSHSASSDLAPLRGHRMALTSWGCVIL